jgi:hypothetical protein
MTYRRGTGEELGGRSGGHFTEQVKNVGKSGEGVGGCGSVEIGRGEASSHDSSRVWGLLKSAGHGTINIIGTADRAPLYAEAKLEGQTSRIAAFLGNTGTAAAHPQYGTQMGMFCGLRGGCPVQWARCWTVIQYCTVWCVLERQERGTHDGRSRRITPCQNR